jgi:DNA invertase Pin-like site-specific DNA recombinase
MARRPRQSAVPQRTEELAVGYSRYSTENQGSTEEQMGVNEEIALSEGVTILKTFYDEGLSRSLSDRPGLQDMFAYLESHPEIGYIVVNELERMTAGVDQRQTITRLCKRNRVTILTEDIGRIDPHDEEKMQEADERAVGAKREVIKVRRRTRRVLRQKIKSETAPIIAMRPPYGIRMKPLVTPEGIELPSGMSMLDSRGRKVTSGQLEKHPDEYPWLVRIFEWADEGKSLMEISRQLMANDVPTKTGKTRWDGTTIAGILENPIYKGEYSWGNRQTLRDETGKRYQEFRDEDDPARVVRDSPLGALVDVAMWDRINARRAARGTTRAQQRRTLDPQALDHYVFCGRCGHKMYSRAEETSKGLSWRYVCLSSYGSMGMRIIPEFGGRCEKAHSISLRDLISGLAGERGYGGKTLPVTGIVGGAARAGTDVMKKRLEAKITAAEEEEARALGFALKGLMTEAQLVETKMEIAERISTLRQQLVNIGSGNDVPAEPIEEERQFQLTDVASRLADDDIPMDLKQRLLSQLNLEAIYVDKPRLRLHFRE